VYVADLFGINENSARVALSRMVASGEVVTSGTGRYRLVGHLLERQQRQLLSRAGRTGRWSGSWHMVALTTTATADVRGQRRRSLNAARLAELRQGLWLRPDNLSLELSAELRQEATVFSGRPEGEPSELARTLWDLRAWASEARDLLRELRALTPDGPAELAPGFVLAATVLRHFQADPLLPPELLPPKWPGAELRAFYEDWDARYRKVLAESSRR
jgi:phenylacetic acid degradation operon negative regulatory protein